MKAANFTRFDLQQPLIVALSELGFEKPTQIQERLIPAIRNGRDVIGQSQTGTGKTLAFLLPIVDKIDPNRDEVQAIVTAPTRELAAQLFEQLQALLQPFEQQIRARLIVGGTDRERTIERLKVQPQIVVGTPGRLADLVDEQALLIHTATMLVVDEADQMLDMGFIADVDRVAGRMNETIQMMVFSATIPEKLQPFLRKYMTNPRHVQVDPQQASAKEVEHCIIPLRHRDKLKFTVELAKRLNPYFAIIFTNTKEEADELANEMLAARMNVERLHGGLQPRVRKQTMKHVNDLKVQYLVATDLAARGIDIKGVSHIINFNLPKDLDFYIHRVGRTARAGADGIAYTIYEQSDQYAIERLRSRGITFKYYDFKNDELILLDRPPLGVHEKKKRTKNEENGPQRTGGKAIARPKKVKPGYKKKAREQQLQQQRRERRIERKANKNKRGEK